MLADAKKIYDLQYISNDIGTGFDILNLSYKRNETKENASYFFL